MPVMLTVKCPHCRRPVKVPVDYDNLSTPFVAKCEKSRSVKISPAAQGCGKYFAVKISVNFEAETSKIFDGIQGKQTTGES